MAWRFPHCCNGQVWSKLEKYSLVPVLDLKFELLFWVWWCQNEQNIWFRRWAVSNPHPQGSGCQCPLYDFLETCEWQSFDYWEAGSLARGRSIATVCKVLAGSWLTSKGLARSAFGFPQNHQNAGKQGLMSRAAHNLLFPFIRWVTGVLNSNSDSNWKSQPEQQFFYCFIKTIK